MATNCEDRIHSEETSNFLEGPGDLELPSVSLVFLVLVACYSQREMQEIEESARSCGSGKNTVRLEIGNNAGGEAREMADHARCRREAAGSRC